ncbi:MAG: Rdx family protein [Psychrilyobacter sp.]|nr:Rdx family protein [Psychrilyobacter sp.]
MDEIVSKFRFNVKSFMLIPSSGGAFELKINDALIYSKLAQGMFPEEDKLWEVMEAEIRSLTE